MPFPLVVGDLTVPDPPALAALVQAECGPVPVQVPGRRPAQWVMDLVESGALERRLAIGLSAALLQNAAAATVCEGARLARRLREPLLGPILVRALQSHDTGLLLQVDPAVDDTSVEDTLLAAAEDVADFADEGVRASFLEYLRHAGLPALEVRVLARWGSTFELETWLPAVLAEPMTEDARAALAGRRARGDAGSAVVARLVGEPPPT
jgi:hypothetical protein